MYIICESIYSFYKYFKNHNNKIFFCQTTVLLIFFQFKLFPAPNANIFYFTRTLKCYFSSLLSHKKFNISKHFSYICITCYET